jgi:hypothetical protein
MFGGGEEMSFSFWCLSLTGTQLSMKLSLNACALVPLSMLHLDCISDVLDGAYGVFGLGGDADDVDDGSTMLKRHLMIMSPHLFHYGGIRTSHFPWSSVPVHSSCSISKDVRFPHAHSHRYSVAAVMLM